MCGKFGPVGADLGGGPRVSGAMLGDEVSIPTPCDEDWSTMARVPGGRHCERCAHSVVDLSLLTDAEVRDLVNRTDGTRVCVSARFRPDGTLVTQDYFRATTCLDPGRFSDALVDDAVQGEHDRPRAARFAREPVPLVGLGDAGPAPRSTAQLERRIPGFVPASALRRASPRTAAPHTGLASALGGLSRTRTSLSPSAALAGASLMLVLAACAPHGGLEDLAPVDPPVDVQAPLLVSEEITLPIAKELARDESPVGALAGEGTTPCDPDDVDLLDAADAHDGGASGGSSRKVPLRGVMKRTPPPPEPKERMLVGLEG